MNYLAQLFVNALHLASDEELQRTVSDESLQPETRRLAQLELDKRHPSVSDRSY